LSVTDARLAAPTAVAPGGIQTFPERLPAVLRAPANVSPVLVLLGLLPVVTGALLVRALRPADTAFAPVRLAVIRAALVTASLSAVAVEGLSLVRGLTRPVLTVVWSVAVLLAAGAVVLRDRRAPDRVALGGAAPWRWPGWAVRRVRAAWTAAGWPDRAIGLALLVLVLAELAVALLWPPNNYDSQTYHLPKIEHWVVQRDVLFFPTVDHRQVTMAPGAEYLLLHLRLLTGGDKLYNLLQLCAGLGCMLLAARIAGQLGGTRRAQLISALAVGTAPMVALESTSTQTDLVVAAWVGVLATLVLDQLRRRTTLPELVLLGAATGMITLTKATGLLAAGPLLLIWGVAQLRLVGRPAAWAGVLRTAGASVLLLACAAAIAGPYLHRLDAAFGSPLGPDYLRTSVSMERHDPGSVLVNALRIGYSALDTPATPVDDAVAHGIVRLSRALGIDPEDPKTTFVRSTFPVSTWPPDEDKASFPIPGVLILLGAGFLLVRPARRVPAEEVVPARAYASAFWVNVVIYVATIKWQPWGNRLVLYLVMLGAPLAGLWADAVLRRRAPGPAGAPATRAAAVGRLAGRLGRTAAAGTLAVALLVSASAGGLAVGYGWPRRLVGPDTIFTMSELRARFQRRPEWQSGYEQAAAAVRASGARRVGLVQSEDTWEYPWWVLLPGRNIVAMQSVVPGFPGAPPGQVDAVLCVVPEADCAAFTPPGWQVHMTGGIGYAVPPSPLNRGR
jgi:hypothetical protein